MKTNRYISFVGSSGKSYHAPIFIQLDLGDQKPPSPFILKSHWLMYEDYIQTRFIMFGSNMFLEKVQVMG
jgi:hypothetical protein